MKVRLTSEVRSNHLKEHYRRKDIGKVVEVGEKSRHKGYSGFYTIVEFQGCGTHRLLEEEFVRIQEESSQEVS